MSVTDLAAGFITAAAIKGPCRVATPGVNITLNGLAVLDSITLIDGDRVLVKDQTNAHENGVYVARAGNWERARDFDSTKEVTRGTRIFVTDGFAGANTEWFVSSLNPVPVGVGPVTFALCFTVGATVPPARKIQAGTGLSGGGDLSADRTIELNIAGLGETGEVSPDADYVAMLDATDAVPKKVKVSTLVGAAGVPTNRQIVAGNGLSGGGDLSANRTLALDLSEVTSKVNVAFATDQIALHDPSAPGPARSPVATFVTDMAKRRATGSDPLAVTVNGAKVDIIVQEEAVSLSGTYVDSAMVVPAGAILLAVSARVTSTIAGTSSFSIGTPGDDRAFAAGLSVAAGTTIQGSVGAGVIIDPTAIRISPAPATTFSGGVVRIAQVFLKITAPTA